MVHEEFIVSLRRLRHFVCLPIKLLALPAAIIYVVLWLRYELFNSSTRQLNSPLWRVVGPPAVATRQLESAWRCMSFWKAETLLLHTGIALIIAIAHHAALAIACYNLGGLLVLTVGLPLLAKLSRTLGGGGAFTGPSQRLLEYAIGFAIPVFVMMQL